ncbi:MAG: asparagine synthase (glutamine-hydrolyzing) [Verrucomicrobia bacterium GWF2_51_19]|nr:MAG: asparagine synthase (glutamine-hydrolyzing) [Verrucomicrobia bacterium GWF2_51_19]
MRDTMVHRGPDGCGHYCSRDGSVGLGHRRLSILDLATSANQPMPNEDKTVWVTFNGEIYNHAGLRRELKAAGHTFQTDHSDTEVLVHGYEEWGIDSLMQRIEGDYAIGLWDERQGQLFLIRDRIGVKPLYFTLTPRGLIFASEIKAILADPQVERDIEPIAMYHYLSFFTTPAPLTMFKGIFKLPPGYCLQFKTNRSLKTWRYWNAIPNEKERFSVQANSEEDHIREIRKRLIASVEKRMMADVPLGVFLSGGVDSSTNVALMSRYMDRPVDTFTVGFKDHTNLNEFDYANRIAKQFKTNHHEILIDEHDMQGYLDALIYSQDEPIADWVCIPLYFVSKLAKDNGMTVIQVGEGSDEQFCGYRNYMGHLWIYNHPWQILNKYAPHFLSRIFAHGAKWIANQRPSLTRYAEVIHRAAYNREHFWTGAIAFSDLAKERLVKKEMFPLANIPEELSNLLPNAYLETDSFNVIQSFNQDLESNWPDHDILARMTYNEFKLRLPELLLMRVDKITMSVSLEARVPFLDHNLVEYSTAIPMHEKIRGNTAKYLLKKAVEGIIPHDIIYRKKMGFGAPMDKWMQGDFGKRVQSSVLASPLIKRGFFDQKQLEHLLKNEKGDYFIYNWILFNLTSWYDYWIG